jgi:hypothetical protein
MIQTLTKNNHFDGKFIALKDLKDNASVVGEGSTPEEALSQALKAGIPDPTLTFVPVKGLVQIY